MWQDSSQGLPCLLDHPLLAGRTLGCPLSYRGSFGVLALRPTVVITALKAGWSGADSGRALNTVQTRKSALIQS